MNTIRIAVVEDEKRIQEQLKNFLFRYEKETQVPLSVSLFGDGESITNPYTAEYDLIFMDIVMPKMDGMTAAKCIRKLDDDVVIIFITSMAKYAIHGYEVGAMDFVLKPLSYAMFAIKMRNAVKAVRRRSVKAITLRQRDIVQKLKLSDIYYIEVDGHYLTFHTVNGELRYLGSLKDVEAQLQSDNFVRCSNYYLINLKYVSSVSGSVVTVAGEGLQISRSRKKELLQAVIAYIGDM